MIDRTELLRRLRINLGSLEFVAICCVFGLDLSILGTGPSVLAVGAVGLVGCYLEQRRGVAWRLATDERWAGAG